MNFPEGLRTEVDSSLELTHDRQGRRAGESPERARHDQARSVPRASRARDRSC